MPNEFRLPGVMHFGWGALERLADEAPRLGRRALLVTGRSSMKKSGVTDRVQGLLTQAGLTFVVYDQVESDPSATTVDTGAELARAESCDLVIGLGGGSPMDAARAIAAMALLEGSIVDYLGGKPIDRPGLPLLNIATTSGTASEITPISVVLHEERKLKMGLKSLYWFARVAITDPELTLTMSPSLTAATGIDALTHAIESHLSTQATPATEALSLRAVELIGRHLRPAVADGGDRTAREGMSLGSMIAGMAFANAGLGLVHGLVHPIGARHGLSHGAACGRLLPYVLRYNRPAAEEKLAHIAQALSGATGATGAAGAEQAASAVEDLLEDVGLPCGIADLDIADDQMPGLAKDTLVSGAVKTNPRPVSEEDARAVLEKARAG